VRITDRSIKFSNSRTLPGQTDDLGREAMAMVRRDGGAHQSRMPQEASDSDFAC
jgi:hypothetical protein